MKIAKLFIQNIKAIREITVYAQDHVNEIAGENETGKTTLINAIKWCFAGGGSIDKKPIRHGEDHGEIVLETDDGLTIRRRFNANGRPSITITDANKKKGNQSMLDKIFSSLSFDPLSFSQMKSDKQAEVIEDFAGEDFRKKKMDLVEKIQETFEDASFQRKTIKAMGELKPVEPAEPVDVSTVYQEIQDIQKKNEAIRDQNNAIDAINSKLDDLSYQLGNNHDELETLQKRIEKVKEIGNQLREEHEKLSQKSTQLETSRQDFIDDSHLQEKLKNIADINTKAEQYNQFLKDKADREKAQNKLKEKEAQLKDLRVQLKTLADECDSIPIDGVSFHADGIYVNNIPWNQLSQSQKIRYSTRIGMSLNPDLRIMFIEDGSLIDKKNLEELIEIARENDYQLWIETVGAARTGEAIVLEAGEIKGAKKRLDDRSV